MHVSLTPRFRWTVVIALVFVPTAGGWLLAATADPTGRHVLDYGMALLGLTAVGLTCTTLARWRPTTRPAILTVAGAYAAVALVLAVVARFAR